MKEKKRETNENKQKKLNFFTCAHTYINIDFILFE